MTTSVPQVSGKLTLDPVTFLAEAHALGIVLYLQDSAGVLAEVPLKVANITPTVSHFGNPRTLVDFMVPAPTRAMCGGTVTRATLMIPGRDPIDCPPKVNFVLDTYQLEAGSTVILTSGTADLLGEWREER